MFNLLETKRKQKKTFETKIIELLLQSLLFGSRKIKEEKMKNELICM